MEQCNFDNRINMEDVISCVSTHSKPNDIIHGLTHWQRVERNAIRLQQPNVNMTVVRLFAYFHDACRFESLLKQNINQSDDENVKIEKTERVEREHGKLASELVLSLRNSLLKGLTQREIDELSTACELHNITQKTGNPTIDTCFDADRLDLWRLIWIKPNPKLMATIIGANLAKDIKKIVLEETSLDFYKSRINYDCQTLLAIRISKTDNKMMFNNYRKWDFAANSFIASFPGIFAINLFWFRFGFDYYFRVLLSTSVSPDDIRIVLLEYSPKDIVSEMSENEFSVSRGNILKTMTITEFYYFCHLHGNIFDVNYVRNSIIESLKCQQYFKDGDKLQWVKQMTKNVLSMNNHICNNIPPCFKLIHIETLDEITRKLNYIFDEFHNKIIQT